MLGKLSGVLGIAGLLEVMVVTLIGTPALDIITSTDQAPPVAVGCVHHLRACNIGSIAERHLPGMGKVRVLKNVWVKQFHLVILQRKLGYLKVDLNAYCLGGNVEHPLFEGLAGFGFTVGPVAKVGIFRIGNEAAIAGGMADTVPSARLGHIITSQLFCASASPSCNPDHCFHGIVPLRRFEADVLQYAVTLVLNDVEDLALCDLDRRGRLVHWTARVSQVIIHLRAEPVVDHQVDLT
mmetsp:Transcript_40346/g.74668  ORF Transcript_40346/g.74668 Transcript_40346/m.74668 type:complete len:238 (-) Transcript_40346:1674-2387(-)